MMGKALACFHTAGMVTPFSGKLFPRRENNYAMKVLKEAGIDYAPLEKVMKEKFASITALSNSSPVPFAHLDFQPKNLLFEGRPSLHNKCVILDLNAVTSSPRIFELIKVAVKGINNLQKKKREKSFSRRFPKRTCLTLLTNAVSQTWAKGFSPSNFEKKQRKTTPFKSLLCFLQTPLNRRLFLCLWDPHHSHPHPPQRVLSLPSLSPFCLAQKKKKKGELFPIPRCPTSFFGGIRLSTLT